MPQPSASFYTNTLPLLDDEFDLEDSEVTPADTAAVGHVIAFAELDWDDQLDNGDEMSL